MRAGKPLGIRGNNWSAAAVLLFLEPILLRVLGSPLTSLSHKILLHVYFIRRKPKTNARAMIRSITQVRSP